MYYDSLTSPRRINSLYRGQTDVLVMFVLLDERLGDSVVCCVVPEKFVQEGVNPASVNGKQKIKHQKYRK